ncbi:hypothetical protein MSAN_01102100 [Mycena sanguinolenta]|uniref:F-box domain-containing protein n=1 Tax=Mycena sanguinolenta TaxID=230812 RepID=A0A8H6YNJ9_9AGAR|nr:hypothetical protein MSAN_01102100 [Mycena sanguinolenta]
MDWIPGTTVETLPNELLAEILKLGADSPLPRQNLVPPFPVAVSRVSRRWRAIMLCSPELWTTIRLSHNSQTWIWASLCAKRSQRHPLDISISLESYIDNGYGYQPLRAALAFVVPRIGRWRTFALRCWEYQIRELLVYAPLWNPSDASQLQSAHISIVDADAYNWDPTQHLHSLPRVFSSPSLRSFRGNMRLCPSDPTAFSNLHSLDVNFGLTGQWLLWVLGRILGAPSCSLETLVVRNFRPEVAVVPDDPLHAPQIRSLALSIHSPTSSAFLISNISRSSVALRGSSRMTIKSQFQKNGSPPLFPHLRILRLEDVRFSRKGLAYIQSLTRNITSLELIYTEANEHLLHQHDEVAWPGLRTLTVETRDSVCPPWLGAFLELRPSPIMELKIPYWNGGVTLPVNSPPEIRWLTEEELSRGLIDSGYQFYIDDFDLRVKYFEQAEIADSNSEWDWPGSLKWEREWEAEQNLQRVEDEINEALTITGEVVRVKGFCRESRKERRRNFKLRHSGNKRSKGRRRRFDVAEDFDFK